MSTAYTPLETAVLESKSLKDLASLHNTLLARLIEHEVVDAKPVNKFKDKKSAVARVQRLEARLEERTRTAPDAIKERKPAKGAKERKRRGPYFVFKPADQQRVPKAGCMRHTAFELMRRPEGASQREIMDAYNRKEQWDLTDQTTERFETMRRRAYEGIRLMHYAHGYGLRFVSSGEAVTETELRQNLSMPVYCYSKEEERDQPNARPEPRLVQS